MPYFDGKIKSGFTALLSGRIIQFISNGLIGLFFPMFLYVQFDLSVETVLWWYLIGNLLYAVILPVSSQVINKVGLRRSIQLSVLFDNLFLFVATMSPEWGIVWLWVSIIPLVIFRLMFWMPFHVDFAKFTDRRNRGKEVGLNWAARSSLSIIMPVISGALIAWFDFKPVLLLAVFISLSSIIPYMSLPRTRETYEWGIIETWQKFFSKNNRGLVLAHMAFGIENSIALVVWPIFIWQILAGNYIAVGLISAVIALVGIVIQVFVGKYTDRFSKRMLLKWGSAFYSIGWIAKALSLTPWQIFWSGAYHQIAKIFKDTPFDALSYEVMADQGHYVDEYTVLREMAINLGKAMVFIFSIIVVGYLGINWTFILAAFGVLFLNLL